MKYIIKLDREELVQMLTALSNDADELSKLAVNLKDEDMCQKIASMARKERALYSKILDTYEAID